MTAANELTQSILDYLNRYGVYAWRMNNVRSVPGRTFKGKKGVPDIVGVTQSGKFIGIEVKVGRDEQSDAQRLFQSEVEKRGAIYLLARKLDDVVRIGL